MAREEFRRDPYGGVAVEDRPATTAPAAGGLRGQVTWASGSVLVLGLWLIAAPWVLGYSDSTTAIVNNVACGAVIALFAAVRIYAPAEFRWLSWANVAIGAWLIVAPWVLSYSDLSGNDLSNVKWNDVIVGALVVLFTLWSANAERTPTTTTTSGYRANRRLRR